MKNKICPFNLWPRFQNQKKKKKNTEKQMQNVHKHWAYGDSKIQKCEMECFSGSLVLKPI